MLNHSIEALFTPETGRRTGNAAANSGSPHDAIQVGSVVNTVCDAWWTFKSQSEG